MRLSASEEGMRCLMVGTTNGDTALSSADGQGLGGVSRAL